MADNRYCADYAKRVAGCKKCKQKIEKGQLRLAKITASPFSDDGEMKLYHHPACMFDTFKRARATTKIIEEPGDIEGFQDLQDDDKDSIRDLIKESGKGSAGSKGSAGGTPKKKAPPSASPAKAKSKTPKKAKEKEDDGEEDSGGRKSPAASAAADEAAAAASKRPAQGDPKHKDNSFREFRRLCGKISDVPSYNAKSEVVGRFFGRGTDGKEFRGDLYVWVRLLLPGVVKRIYNLQSKQLCKVFARIFGCHEEDLLEDLEAGDVAETVATFFDKSSKVEESAKSSLTIHQVDDFLSRLTTLTKEDDQQRELTKISKLCTKNDLKMVVRLIKGDLRINAGAKHILDGLHKDAYAAFNSSRNIVAVLDKILELRKEGKPNGPLEVGCALMHPVQPMLAAPCKSVDMAFDKCPNGMYSEIKYDGERVQLHKRGKEFKYYSRALKPVLPHKVKPFAEYIPKAFPDGSDLILDAEVLMVDKEGKPLPFGTLGKHKAAGFKDATPCLFVFDCIYYNGKSLMNRPIQERRKHLHDHMKEVGNHVKFSEMKVVTRKQQLGDMIKKVFREGLEGLVLKDMRSQYEPGKRHWLKVKKDYLNEGAMADSADLVVLGAWYGSGNKGGIMSIFLMGCYNERTKKWCTVTKVHTGVDEATLDRLQDELKPNMTKIKQDYNKVPDWLNCTRQMAPDFVAKDPKKSPVWEITGAEFTKAEIHTADGISIRFPRITKRRDDKDWRTATSLEHLKGLVKTSKEKTDFDIDYSSKDGGGTNESEEEGSGARETKGEKSKKSFKEEMEEEEDAGAYSDETEVDSDEEEDDKGKVTKVKRENGSSPFPLSPRRKSYNKTRIEGPNGLLLTVITGDLFSASPGVSLAHCISRDCKMSKGIAKIFREKFGRVREIEACGTDVGGVAILRQMNGRFIYNLVTKERYSDKPTYETLEQSLQEMREHARKNGVAEIAMPKIGCGLDGLQWNAVRTLVKNVFLEEDIKITVYSLDDEDGEEELQPAGSPRYKASRFSSPAKREPSSSPTKRRQDGSEDGSPSKQPTIRDMFARARDSPERKKRKLDATNGSAREGTSPSSPSVLPSSPPPPPADLPDVFGGWKVLLTPGVADQERLSRYVTAYGGEVLKAFEAAEATHVVYPGAGKRIKTEDGAEEAQHVTERLLVDSIKKKRAQDAEDYRV